MNLEYFKNSLQYLEKELGKGIQRFSEVQVKKIRDGIINESEKSLEAAFDYLILNHNGLPTPQKLIDAVRIEASKNRDASWQKEKREYQKPLVANTELSRGAMKIIKQFFPNEDEFGFVSRVNYKTILADAQSMAIRYPGSDWPNIYSDWKEQWTVEGKIN